jgi:hypothetical protein
LVKLGYTTMTMLLELPLVLMKKGGAPQHVTEMPLRNPSDPDGIKVYFGEAGGEMAQRGEAMVKACSNDKVPVKACSGL